MKLEFSGQIFEKYSTFLKIHPVGAELFLADGQTDMTKLIDARKCRLTSLRFQAAIRTSVFSYSVLFSNSLYEGWNFNSGNYLFTTDTK